MGKFVYKYLTEDLATQSWVKIRLKLQTSTFTFLLITQFVLNWLKIYHNGFVMYSGAKNKSGKSHLEMCISNTDIKFSIPKNQ